MNLGMRLVLGCTLTVALACSITACSNQPVERQSPAEETSSAAEPVESVAGTYVGEFGAIIDLEEDGTLDLMIPLTIELAEDGTVSGSWSHSTDVPMPDLDTFTTDCEFTGTLESDALEASGKATSTLEAPMGSLTDSTGVIITGQLSGENIIGDVEGYGDTEGFIVTRQ